MKKDLNLIVFLLDRSGSMKSCKEDVIGGFNQFIKDQKDSAGEVKFTMAQFDNLYELVYNAVPIANVPDLSAETFQPRGSTALLDSMAKLIDDTGVRLSRMDESERPERVIFVIYTDGEENSSQKETWQTVEKRITHQNQTYKWQFVYLGANQDAIATACHLNIAAKDTLHYNTAKSAEAFASASKLVKKYIQTDFADVAAMGQTCFEEQDRQEQSGAV